MPSAAPGITVLALILILTLHYNSDILWVTLSLCCDDECCNTALCESDVISLLVSDTTTPYDNSSQVITQIHTRFFIDGGDDRSSSSSLISPSSLSCVNLLLKYCSPFGSSVVMCILTDSVCMALYMVSCQNCLLSHIR